MNPDVEKVLSLWGARILTAADKLDGSVVLNVTDAKCAWVFGVGDEPYARQAKDDDDADCVVSCSGRVILDIEDRQCTPQEAFQSGDLKVKGESELALNLFEIIGEVFRL